MIYAPEHPTTEMLHAEMPLERRDFLVVAGSRIAIDQAIRHPDNTLTIAGPCAATDDMEELAEEQMRWQEVDGVIAVRRNVWKPRGVMPFEEKLDKWHGLETGHPNSESSAEDATTLAFRIVRDAARRHGNVAMELASPEHVLRYGPLASFAWVGPRTRTEYYAGREDEYHSFIELLAKREPTLPIGIKSDHKSGDIERALQEVDRINTIRGNLGYVGISRAVLIYRGDGQTRTADAWQARAAEIIEQTGGAVMLDMAHGAEMACDPDDYKKSVEGQLIAWDRAIELRQGGYRWVGQLTESSDLESPMDPPIPIDAAMEKVRQMNLAREQSLSKV